MGRGTVIQPSQYPAIVEAYLDGATSSTLAVEYGVKPPTIIAILKKMNVQRRPKGSCLGLSRKQRESIVARYVSGESSYAIASDGGCAWATVLKLVRLAGQPVRTNSQAKRQYPLRENAFDVWADDAAYWAGFLAADGCIEDTDGRVRLGLAGADREHVEAFRVFMGHGKPVQQLKLTSSFSAGTVAYGVCFNSVRVVARLREAGLRQHNQTVACDELANNPHFWRGVIDGDGTINLKVPAVVGVVGGRDLLGQFLAFAKSLAPLSRSTVHRHKSIWEVRINSDSAVAVLERLYPPGCVALERKRLRAADAIARQREWERTERRRKRSVRPASEPETGLKL